MDQLKGKTAIVTGAAQAIGLAIARRLQDEGANEVICEIIALPRLIFHPGINAPTASAAILEQLNE